MIENFVRYMFFSFLEFFAVFLLIFNFYNLRFKYYWKEIVIGTFIITLLSYLLTASDLYKVIPLPLVIIPIITLIFVAFMKQKVLYSIVIVTGISIFYGFLQFGVSSIALVSGAITNEELNNAFLFKTNVLQALCAFIAITISLYVKSMNNGFGFSLIGDKKYVFPSVVIGLFVICCLFYILLYIFPIVTTVVIMTILLFVSSMIFFYFSYKQDQSEFK